MSNNRLIDRSRKAARHPLTLQRTACPPERRRLSPRVTGKRGSSSSSWRQQEAITEQHNSNLARSRLLVLIDAETNGSAKNHRMGSNTSPNRWWGRFVDEAPLQSAVNRSIRSILTRSNRSSSARGDDQHDNDDSLRRPAPHHTSAASSSGEEAGARSQGSKEAAHMQHAPRPPKELHSGSCLDDAAIFDIDAMPLTTLSKHTTHPAYSKNTTHSSRHPHRFMAQQQEEQQ